MIIPAEYFYIIATVVTVTLLLIKISTGNVLIPGTNASEMRKVWLLGIFFIIFFGFRDAYSNILGDTSGYTAFFNWIKDGSFPPDLNLTTNGKVDFSLELGFYFIRNQIALAGWDVTVWFTVVAIIYIVPIIFAIRRLFPGYEYLAFLFFIVGSGFLSGGANGIRNANACSLFFLGFSLFFGKNPKIYLGFFFIILSYFFHHSIIISIAAFAVSLVLVRKTNTAILIWLSAIILVLLFGNTLAEFAGDFYEDKRMIHYLKGGQNMSAMEKAFSFTGFRWDFLLYSAVPIWLGWYVTVRRGIKDRTYQMLLNTYILANAIWVCFMYAAFTNRYAAMSWALYPFVILYPLVKYNIWGESQSFIVKSFLVGLYLFFIIYELVR